MIYLDCKEQAPPFVNSKLSSAQAVEATKANRIERGAWAQEGGSSLPHCSSPEISESGNNGQVLGIHRKDCR